MARIVDQTNQLTAPAWAGDYFNREHMIPGGARIASAQWATVTHTITTTAQADAAATSIAVSALTVALPSGTILDFTGTGELAKLTSAAALGATSLAVEALDAQIESGDTATFVVTDAVPVTVASGTVIGRTIAERDAGTAFGPADASDDEVYITCFDVYDASVNPDVELYRPNSIVKENFLPGWSGLASGVKTKVRAAYVCVRGAA